MAGVAVPVPGWFSPINQDCGVAVGDVDGNGDDDVVVLLVDNPPQQNGGSYRVGHRLADDGTAANWGPWHTIPDWFGWENQGASIALADLDGSGRPDLILLVVDNPAGQNEGYLRIGRNLAPDGAVTGGWTAWQQIPEWFGWENQGADIAVTILDGEPAVVVLVVDNPIGQNSGQFRVGSGLRADGTLAFGWGEWIAVPDWYGWENQGAGITVADLDGDGRPELIVMAVDNPAGPNSAQITVGWGLTASGHCVDGWSAWDALDDWGFDDNQGASLAVLPHPGARPELVVLTVAGPVGVGSLRVAPLALDIDEGHHHGAWRILDFGTEINPVHAALLHTGDVLLFAGSGNDEIAHAAHAFRTRLWHYPGPDLDAPGTPIDLFCAGQCVLADGQVLAAGGTDRYDPFYGLTDALLFDPVAGQWQQTSDMEFGRWYPSLVTLPDGRAVAVSGLGTDNHLSVIPEIFDPATGTWTPIPSPGPVPMYANLLLLTGGRLFYTGAQYGGNNGMRPSVWDPATGQVTEVLGLVDPGLRNQAASVLMPPAQDQRVMIIGGGGFDMHSPAPALADTRIVDLSVQQPNYVAGPPLMHPRMHVCAVILPDRSILATGGSGMEEMAHDAPPFAELLKPGAAAWEHTAATRVPRLYHSVALLTPDGKVITAGSNPQRRTVELRIEVYWPPYLFHAEKPAFDLADDHAGYGDTLTVTVHGPLAPREFSLVRPGATTHSADNEQRLVDVPFTGGTTATLQLPDDPSLAPPGWYLLHVVDTHGVPSTGRWLHLS